MVLSKVFKYKDRDIELFCDGKYITKFTISKNNEIYEEEELQEITRDLIEPLLSDIYYDIDNEEEN